MNFSIIRQNAAGMVLLIIFTCALIAPQVSAQEVIIVSSDRNLGFGEHSMTPIPEYGPMSPYPYPVTGANIPGSIVDVNVIVDNFWHERAADLDMLLVGPQGQAVMIMSDACSGAITAAMYINFTFDDEAANVLPNTTPCVSGSYLPTNWNTGADVSPDNFPAPAPQGVTNTSLSVFDGTDPNGVWAMYVVDNRSGAIGAWHAFKVVIVTTEAAVTANFFTPTPTPFGWTPSTSTPTNTTAPSACVVISRLGIDVTEGGVSVIYNVRLSQAPIGGEQITITPIEFDTTQISITPANRKLDGSNWNTGRNFTVTPLDDANVESSPQFTVIHHLGSSNYGGSPLDSIDGCEHINVRVFDNDTAAATATFTPTNTLIPPTHTPTHTPTNLPTNTPTASATATDTFVPTATATATATSTATPTTPVTVCVIVNRTAITLNEGGASTTYNVRLISAPAPGETVTIMPTGYDTTQVAISPSSRMLDASTWNTGRNFNISAVDDVNIEANPAAIYLSHITMSPRAGSPFNGASQCVHTLITVYDNDSAGSLSEPSNVEAPADAD